MAFVLATMFWRGDKNTVDDGNFFMGVLFYSLLYQLLEGTAEMHLLCDRLPVFFKQRQMRFYPGEAQQSTEVPTNASRPQLALTRNQPHPPPA